MNGVSGRLDEVEYLAYARFSGVAAFGGDSRFQAEPHEAEQNGLKYKIVVLVQRTVHEDASIEVVVLWQVALSARRKGVSPWESRPRMRPSRPKMKTSLP